MFAFLLAKFKIPKKYSKKREFFDKLNDYRKNRKEKVEIERKESALIDEYSLKQTQLLEHGFEETRGLLNKAVKAFLFGAVTQKKKEHQREMIEKLKIIQKQENLISKR